MWIVCLCNFELLSSISGVETSPSSCGIEIFVPERSELTIMKITTRNEFKNTFLLSVHVQIHVFQCPATCPVRHVDKHIYQDCLGPIPGYRFHYLRVSSSHKEDPLHSGAVRAHPDAIKET
jgi:hypothetical protein